MKNAAKCEKCCDLHESVSHLIFERKWHCYVSSSMSVWESQNKINSSWELGLTLCIVGAFGLNRSSWWASQYGSMCASETVVPISHSGRVAEFWTQFAKPTNQIRSQIRQDYPLNLSISISGGKETNKDSLSNGEWSGNSSNLKSGVKARIVV